MSQATSLQESDFADVRAAVPAAACGMAYLNAGTLGPMPQVAIDAVDAANAYDSGTRQCPGYWDRLFEQQAQARGALARLAGVEPAQLALMHTTHEGINTCVWGLELAAGDNLVTTDEEHPGLLVPLRHRCERAGCEVRIAAWASDDDAFVANVVEQVDDSTRALLLSHVSWVSGRIAPLRALREALPDDVRIIVDGAQSAGIVPIDAGDGWDAYTISGQKWPCGPNGSGGLALRDPLAWLPTFGAGMQVASWDDCFGSAVVDDARRFEHSQEALAPLAGITASVGWLLDDVGVERAAHAARQWNAVARASLEASGITPDRLHGPAHLLCIDVPEGSATDVTDAVAAAGAMVRPLGTSRVRLSFGPWNVRDEVVAACDAIARAAGVAESQA